MKAAALALAVADDRSARRRAARAGAGPRSVARPHARGAGARRRCARRCPTPKPNFKVHIEAIHPMHDIFDKVPWATEPVGWQPPGLGFDLLSVFRYVAKTAADAKRERDVQRRARGGAARDRRLLRGAAQRQPHRDLRQLAASADPAAAFRPPPTCHPTFAACPALDDARSDVVSFHPVIRMKWHAAPPPSSITSPRWRTRRAAASCCCSTATS